MSLVLSFRLSSTKISETEELGLSSFIKIAALFKAYITFSGSTPLSYL